MESISFAINIEIKMHYSKEIYDQKHIFEYQIE